MASEESPIRIQWVGKLEYLLASIGYMVGLGNLWRFPHRCLMNGGGAFFIPYLITFVLCAFPMLCLEIFLGQFASEGAITAWKFCPIFKGIGWAIMFNLVMTNVYYTVIVMYSFYYMVVSFVSIGGQLPWQECPNQHTPLWSTAKCSKNPFPDHMNGDDKTKIDVLLTYMDTTCVNGSKEEDYLTFKEEYRHCLDYKSPESEYWNRFVLGVHESGGLDDLGAVVGRNAFCLLIVWLFVFYCCHRGIRSIAKVAYITATFPVLLLLILLVRGVTLEGHNEGIQFYTTPDWSKLGDMAIWSSAATQSMYSVGVAFGSHIILASYNKFDNNTFRDGLILGVVNTCTSIFGGFIVFSFLGHASTTLDIDLKNMKDEGPGLLFISYIQGISLLPGSAVWSFLFFMMVFTLGLDSVMVMVWTLYASIADVFPQKFKRYHKVYLAAICLIQFLLGLPLVTKGGIHFVVLLDAYTANFSLTIFLLVESVSVCWIYGLRNFISDVQMMTGTQSAVIKWYLAITWLVTSPVFCVFIFLASAISYARSEYGETPVSDGGEAIGWLIIITPVLIVLAFAVYQVFKNKRPHSFKELKKLIQEATVPYSSWGPRSEEDRIGRYATNEYITPISDSTELSIVGAGARNTTPGSRTHNSYSNEGPTSVTSSTDDGVCINDGPPSPCQHFDNDQQQQHQDHVDDHFQQQNGFGFPTVTEYREEMV